MTSTTTPTTRHPAPPARTGKRGRAWKMLGVLAVALQLWMLYTTSPPQGPSLAGIDKLAHLAMFALPAVAFAMAGIRALLVGLPLAAHAGISELVQYHWVAGRSGSPADVAADLLGIGGGLAAAGLARRGPGEGNRR